MSKHSHVCYSERTKPLVRLIEQVGCRHSTWQVFADFLTMSAASISNSIDPLHRGAREKLYMETVQRYSKDEVQLFPNMFARLVEIMEECAESKQLDDILGKVFHELELHNKYQGQFFTPMSVGNMMGSVSAADIDTAGALAAKGYLTASEPCIGSGALLLGLANALHEKGVNYCQQLVVTGVDVDIKCVHMAYLQLSLYGIPAVIIHGNTLTCEEWSRWYTPVYVANGWLFREHCGITSNTGREDDERLKCVLDPMYYALRKLESLQGEAFAQPGDRSHEAIIMKKQLWFIFFEPRKEDKMGALYGNMSITEINETARNLREANEREALLSLAAEEGVDEVTAMRFYHGEADELVDELVESTPNSPSDSTPNSTPNLLRTVPPDPVEEVQPSGESGAEKLRREASNNQDKRFPVEPIAAHLGALCEKDDAFDRLVAQPHKSLKKCCDYIFSEARRQSGNGGGICLEDTVVYQMAESYYRLDDAELERKKAEQKAANASRQIPTPQQKSNTQQKPVEKPPAPKSEKIVPDQLSLF